MNWTLIGVMVGFLFGFNGVSMIFNMLNKVVHQTHLQVSTLLLLLIAIVLIVKVRILTSLLVGAVIGAIINFVLEMNGIDVMNILLRSI